MSNGQRKKADKRSLTDRQKAVAHNYLADHQRCKSKAYRSIYGEIRRAATRATELWKNPAFQDYLAELAAQGLDEIANASKEADLTATNLLREWLRIAFSDPGELFTDSGQLKHIKDLPRPVRQAISSMKVKTVTLPHTRGETAEVEYITEIQWWDKNTALSSLGKHLGLLRKAVDDRERRWGHLSDAELIAEVKRQRRKLDEIISLAESEGCAKE